MAQPTTGDPAITPRALARLMFLAEILRAAAELIDEMDESAMLRGLADQERRARGDGRATRSDACDVVAPCTVAALRATLDSVLSSRPPEATK